jgi:hypothetical protein
MKTLTFIPLLFQLATLCLGSTGEFESLHEVGERGTLWEEEFLDSFFNDDTSKALNFGL